METFSALLAICVGNSPVPSEFPTQMPVTRSFDVFFDLRLNKRLSKQWWGWWFETLSSLFALSFPFGPENFLLFHVLKILKMSFGPASSETLMQRLYRAHCDVNLMTDLKYSHLQGFKVTSHLAGHHQCNSKYGLNPSYDQVMGIFSWFHKHFKYQSFDIKTTSKPSSYLAWLLIAPIRLQWMVIECHGRKKGHGPRSRSNDHDVAQLQV